MSFWDKVKEFVGVDEDYIDDEFYDDYDDYDYDDEVSYEEKSSIIEEDTEYKPSYNTETVTKTEEKPSYKPETQAYVPNENSINKKEERSFRRSNTSIKDSKNSSMFVSIREPLTYEDGKVVLDDIMEGKSVVLNLEMLEVDKKTQIFYFVSGGLYSLNGTIQNVTKDIYVLAPQGIEIDGSVKADLSTKNLYQI